MESTPGSAIAATPLADLVATSQRVGSESARRAKVRQLASFLQGLSADEIETAVHFLSGEISQGRIGISYKALQAAVANQDANQAADQDANLDAKQNAKQAALSIAEVDRSLAAIDGLRGAGSAARRTAALRALFSRTTLAEQEFLLRLVVGELRQGALAGVMLEAIAAAADVPLAAVRRAAMNSKSLGAVARVALLEGAESLAAFQLELFKP